MPWDWAALMPHPPIIVPEVGLGREKEAAVTLAGIGRIMNKLKSARRPDCLFLLSPHQHYMPGALFINNAPQLSGSFAPYNARSVVFEISSPEDEHEALLSHLRSAGIPIRTGDYADLTDDQGSLVPLYYLRKIWDYLPPVIFASPAGIDPGVALKLGQALARMTQTGHWALLASADLSHRLKPGAPAGYSPEGEEFDKAVVKALEERNPGILTSMPPAKIESAGECGLRSVMAFLGLCKGLGGKPIEVLSYEGPFGVGYCNALWENR